MTRVQLAPEIQDDFDRILKHLIEHEVSKAPQRVNEIIEAVEVLHHNPHIGRRVDENLRELIIGRSNHGYVALYRYLAAIDTVFVLAIRSQRESGYTRT
jgi:toxin ParE1/3/4